MAYDWQNDPNNPDALPPWTFFGGWKLSEWITWHKASVRKYGAHISDEYFIGEWWNVSERRPWYVSPPFPELMSDTDSAAYLKENNLWPRLFRGLSIGGEDVLPGMVGVPQAFAETGQTASAALDKTLGPTVSLLQILPKALPYILVGAGLLFVWPYLFPAIARAAAATKTSGKRKAA